MWNKGITFKETSAGLKARVDAMQIAPTARFW